MTKMNSAFAILAKMKIDLFLQRELFGNTIREYITSISIFFLILLFLYLFRFLFAKRLKRFVKKTRGLNDNFIFDLVNNSIRWPLMVAIGINLSVKRIELHEGLVKFIDGVTIVVIGYYVIKALQEIAKYIIGRQIATLEIQDRKGDSAVLKTIRKVVIASIWLFVGLVVLQTLGVNVSALIAGVGVGGIAIAFALQSILEDMFASVSLHFDKPFKVGDVIKVGEDIGTVETIGTKTSRIKTLSGEQLSVPNKELTQTRIRNMSRLKRRRVLLNIGIIYETPVDKIKKVKEIVKTIVESLPEVDFSRIHLKDLGEYSLNYEVVFFINNSSYEFYMDRLDEFNIRLMEEFAKEKIEFAYPTQTTVVSKASSTQDPSLA